MKFKIFYLIFLCAGMLFLTSSKNGRADDKNWGNTGAPGDQLTTDGNGPRTCVTCHNNTASIQVLLDIELIDNDGNSIDDGMYIPGQTYRTRVTVDPAVGSPARFGFQILCLNAPLNENGDEVNTWANPTSNVKISFASNTGRTYPEQNGPSTDNVFEMDWTAPAVGSGTVTFYSCGNGVNNNNMTSGDGADCTTLVLEEGMVSANNHLDMNTFPFEVSPNPVVDNINITFSDAIGNTQIRMLDIAGRQLYFQEVTVSENKGSKQISMESFNAGLYFLQVTNGQEVYTEKIIKQ